MKIVIRFRNLDSPLPKTSLPHVPSAIRSFTRSFEIGIRPLVHRRRSQRTVSLRNQSKVGRLGLKCFQRLTDVPVLPVTDFPSGSFTLFIGRLHGQLNQPHRPPYGPHNDIGGWLISIGCSFIFQTSMADVALMAF